jgi:hypothetical protein
MLLSLKRLTRPQLLHEWKPGTARDSEGQGASAEVPQRLTSLAPIGR